MKVSRNESDLSTSKVRVLTSVTRITIGHDSKMTVEGQGRGNNASISRSKAMSFRSVQRKESILQKRRRDEQEEDESVPDRQKVLLHISRTYYIFADNIA